ncbi:MAG: metallophosphoesterase [Catenulispora sp.]|nr:metallophosphoesterase [Catenulispora sp.]
MQGFETPSQGTDSAWRGGRLLAVSDLHAALPDNRSIVDGLSPGHPEDWLLVAGDVAEIVADFEAVMASLAARFVRVVWVPGNHELWTHQKDPVRLRGVERYQHLVHICRRLGIATPEDPYPVWTGPDGPVVVAPLFVLYDYSFHPPGTDSVEAGLAVAYRTGIVCNDEFLLHPDPFPTRQDWCHARLAYTEKRLSELDPQAKTVLVSHFPLIRQPTEILRYPEFAQWCGTVHTADWHTRFRASVAVYGHLHTPRTTHHDGVRFEEVSLGYPREWRHRAAKYGAAPYAPRVILPEP